MRGGRGRYESVEVEVPVVVKDPRGSIAWAFSRNAVGNEATTFAECLALPHLLKLQLFVSDYL
jgi:hypothetical protein